MDIEIAKNSGYCFGVKRALDLTEKTIKKRKNKNVKIYTLGQIIHNKAVVRNLEKRGIKAIEDENVIELGSIFIVRSHGMPPQILEKIKSRGIKVVDATCPYVKRAQSKAKMLSKRGYHVVIIGSKKHPEVLGVKAHVKQENLTVIENPEELSNLKSYEKIGVIIQTTQTMENVQKILSGLLKKGKEILIENTICYTTEKRQNDVKDLAKRVDVMIIIGGKNSANTTHLAELARKYNQNTYHIENCRNIKSNWFKDGMKIGISSGASTPQKDIKEVKKFLENLNL
jgi:4-hydroxy-3-methylbut-2-enyl diphosphate reductase